MKRRLPSGEERDLFEETLKGTKPLKSRRPRSQSPPKTPKPSRAQKQAKPVPPPPEPLPASRAKPATRRPDEPSGLDGRTADRLRRGLLSPDARLDLHGLTEAAGHRALITFVKGAQARGLRLLLVVTGKGNARDEADAFDMFAGRSPRGILREMTPRWLKERELAGLIADVRAAHRRHGGEGALYVYLRKPRS